MALPAALAGSWNPFRVAGTSMPANVLLMAKLIAVAALGSLHFRQLQDPFCPFVPLFDAWHGEEIFRTILQVVFVASAVALIFNRAVRTSAFILGCCFLVGVISSRGYYANNKTLCGLLLVLAAIVDSGRLMLLFRLQFFLVYFGAGLNKLHDGDWQTGLFFGNWMGGTSGRDIYLFLAERFPALDLGLVFCWGVIAIEFFLALGIFVPRLLPAVLWVNILFQAGMAIFAGHPFNMFLFGMTAFTFALVRWPDKILVLYDGTCGFCQASKNNIGRFDFNEIFDWQPYQSGVGHAFGISDEAANERLQLVDAGRVFSGFRAFRWMLLHQAWWWMLVAGAVAALPSGLWLRVVLIALLVLLSPLFYPIGEWAYMWVARNRYWISSATACELPRKPPV